jgi:predicted hotdog family 3-hydroxylacyl-ACP dehydratase
MSNLPPMDKAAIARAIPHAGAMSLLETVIGGDRDWIACTAISHRDPANPLRHDGRLPASAAAEYASQAIALHASLTGIEREPRRGFLAVVNNLSWTRDRLDDIVGDLEIRAEQLAATGAALQYAITVVGDGQILVMGELMVALERA